MAFFPQASPPTPCAHLYPPPYVPHALPISFVSILPPAQYWVRSTDHSAPRYAAYTKTHSGYKILIDFPRQQWLCERASMLRYMYITCLVTDMCKFNFLTRVLFQF